MILQTTIKNYLSHKNTIIDFCPGVNIITGPSDAGKSSVLRPMIWNITNRPTGDGMRNWDCDENDAISCRISTPEGFVEKCRQQNKVIYRLDSNSAQMTFEAFKTDIPDEVSTFFDFSEFNYQSQHSPYFLLNESGGTIATKLNNLVGLSIIDTMFKNLNSLATSSKKSSEKEGEAAQRLQEQIEALAYIDKVKKKLDEIALLVTEYEERQAKLLSLSSTIIGYKKAQEEIDSHKPIISLKEQKTALLKDIEIYEAKKKNLASLAAVISRYKQCEETITIGNEWASIEPEVNSLIKDIGEYSTRKEKHSQISKLLTYAIECNEKITSEKEWLTVENNLNEIYPLVLDYLSRKDKLTKLSQITSDYGSLNIDEMAKVFEKVKKEKQSLLEESGVCPYCLTELSQQTIFKITYN